MTAGFLWLLVRELDRDALVRAFAELSVSIVIPALVFVAAGWALRIMRWWLMLCALEPTLRLRACVGPFLAGMAGNNVLPFRAGDALRVVGFHRQLRVPAPSVAATLVIERVLDVTVLTAVFFLGLLGLPDGAFPRGFVVAAAWLAGVGGAAVLALLLFSLCQRIGSTGLVAVASSAPTGRKSLSRRGGGYYLSRHVRALQADAFRLIGLSVAAWACEGAVFVTVATGLQTGAEPPGPWFAFAAGTLATAIPGTPGHLGTFDYFSAQGLAAYNASPERAAAFALTVHAVLWVSSTAAGLPALLRSRPFTIR